MKKFRFFLAAMLMLTSTAMWAQAPQQRNGQGRPQGGERQRMTVQQRAEREAGRINQAVELTDAQIAEVFKVTFKYAALDSIRMDQMRAQREQGQQFDREAMMKQREETQKAKNADLNAIFTPEQKAKYEKFLKEQEAQRGQGRPQGGQGRPEGGRPQGGRPQGGEF